jgi:hypothetical protein
LFDILSGLDYRPTTEFGVLAGEILADLERLRPGIPKGASSEEILRLCKERLSLRLPEIYREYQADAESGEEEAQLALYRRELEQLLLPRYAALVEKQNAVERREGPSRSGELYNRLTYAALFFALGLFVVWAPFIPIWDKWIPFVLAIIAPLASPWLPDLYQRLMQRRHALQLGILHMDLDQAGRSLPLPPAALPASSVEKAAAKLVQAATQKQKQ